MPGPQSAVVNVVAMNPSLFWVKWDVQHCNRTFGRFFETARTALPGEEPQTKKNQTKNTKKIKIINKTSQMNQK
jgi:hypothetical protein